ncbi:precorrin-6A reductase [uncultured Methanobacterium sp.]|uniref:precorrin-6A reductase n=1 Tax=uncultured Methanobacterium sp. TaxID=176306 RepID=UPI002803BF5A|nr:precorrin-6A reductase [uncultured Methanobacterium sp.]
MMKLMVMAGTSDARHIIHNLSRIEGIYVLATATTSHGVELAQNSGADKVLNGPFNAEELMSIMKDKDIEIIIDATHPFASAATKNAINAADSLGVPYIRFERPSTNLPDNDLIHPVGSFEDAIEIIKEIMGVKGIQEENNYSDSENLPNGRILHLAGVNTLHYLTEALNPELVVARVLPMTYSIEKSLELGIPPRNIVAMEGTFSTRFNGSLMEEFQIKIVLTKESGQSGGTMSKIQAALNQDVPVVVVMRPEIEELKDKLVFGKVDLLVDEVLSRSESKS